MIRSSQSRSRLRSARARRRLAAFGSGLLLLVACASQPGEPRLRTHYDDKRVGRDAAVEFVRRMGLLGDAELDAYLTRVGKSLLLALPERRFDYSFEAIDVAEPNAFALPGGYVYLTRGLLALLNDEDELACILGHEIIHVERRHAARRQSLAERENPLMRSWNRAAQRASFSREMEREADLLGQRLCASAGYDPQGMASLLGSLEKIERLRFGFTRGPGFFDTHPGSRERRIENASRAGKLSWTRRPDRGDPVIAFLARIQGIAVGQRPESGVVVGDRFLHPGLDFQISFPAGWRASSTGGVAGAVSPETGAVVFLIAEPDEGEAEEARETAARWFEELDREDLRVEAEGAVRVRELPAWRMDLRGARALAPARGHATFFSYNGHRFRVVGVAPSRAARPELPRTRTTTRSFRPLSAENRRRIETQRLEVVEARAGESIHALSQRTGNAWPLSWLAAWNGTTSDRVFAGGELVKIVRKEPYQAPEATAGDLPSG